jgi:uncharacterized protein involved in exopolysaccharide biosynthesis
MVILAFVLGLALGVGITLLCYRFFRRDDNVKTVEK